MLSWFVAHFSLTSRLKSRTAELHPLSKDCEEDRVLLVNSLIHSADLCNSVLPSHIALQWSSRIMTEFENQVREFHLSIILFLSFLLIYY